MNAGIGHRQEPARVLSQESYLLSMQSYLQGAGEVALQRAYDIGRTALAEGTGLLVIARIHGACLETLLLQSASPPEQQRIRMSAAEFFAECISPYEMTYRGFRDANIALRHFNEVLEHQARRIGHALHDEAGQLLVAVYIALETMAQEVAPAGEHVAKVIRLLDQIEAQLRRLSHELTPTILNDLGLVPALRYLSEGLAQRSRLTISIDEVAKERLPATVESVLYRIAQESLNNIVRHAQATHVSIRLRREHDSIHCSIRDNGIGFDVASVNTRKDEQGFGLLGIRERVGVLGGTLQINSAAGAGTELVIYVPLEN